MVIQTRAKYDNDGMPVSVMAVTRHQGVTSRKVIPVGPADDLWEIHKDAAREVSNRPAVRLSYTTENGYLFSA